MRQQWIVWFIVLSLIVIVQPVFAATFNVANATDLINSFNTMTTGDRINFTADITLDTVDNTTGGPNGLPVITVSNITIAGNGFTLARNTSASSFRLLYLESTASVTINNLTIRDGDVSNDGGGIYNAGGNLTITNSIVSDNSAGSGGGIFQSSGTLTLTNSTLSTNSANSDGGGILSMGTVTLNNSTASDNSAGSSGGGIFHAGGVFTIDASTLSGNSAMSGGGIYNDGTLTLTDSTLSSNPATTGGGIFNNSNALTLTDSTFFDNPATSGGGIFNGGTVTVSNVMLLSNGATGNGGGILNSGDITFNNSTLSDNSAAFGGGIYNFDFGDITFNNSMVSANSAFDGGGVYNLAMLTLNTSTVTNNTATSAGGGIANTNTVIVNNSTFSGNSADLDGGGIGSVSGNVTVSNSTLSGNSAGSFGGAIFNSSNLTLNNSTLAGNSGDTLGGGGIANFSELTLNNSIIAESTSGADYFDSGNETLQGTNIVEDGSLTGPDISNVNPGLAALADNGGPTETHALSNTSPAINDSSSTATTNDQRGAAAVGIRDIGAFEFGSIFPTVTFSIDQTTLVESDTATITVTVSNYAGETIDVYFGQTGSTTREDYTFSPSMLTFTGDGSQIITVMAVEDALVEGSETLDLELLVVGAADVTDTNPQSITIQDMPSDDPAEDPIPAADIDVSVFAPAISKVGFLIPGEVGETGEQIEWVVRVTNASSVTGQNVTITDVIDSRLQINNVEAVGATVTITGQTLTVIYPTLDVGQSVQLSVFTTVLQGELVTNTACIYADNGGTEQCTTGSTVAQLPNTGEVPVWRTPLLIALGVFAVLLLWVVRARRYFVV
jgi:hypothetical protein